MDNVNGLKKAIEIAEKVKSDLGNSIDISVLINRLEKELELEYNEFIKYISKERNDESN